MGQVLIRNLDDEVIAAYKAAATRHGRSLEAELREALATMQPRARLAGGDLIALSESLRVGTPAKAATIDSTSLIREDRDAR